MAARSLRFLSPALEGVPLYVDVVERSEEADGIYRGIYRIDIELTVEDPVALRRREHRLERSRATVVTEENGVEIARVHGIITEPSIQWGTNLDGAVLNLTLRPRVWTMTWTRANETFVGLSVRENLARKLVGAGLKEGEDFLFMLRTEPTAPAPLHQRGEPDLDFFCMVCKALGLAISFRQSDGRDVLVLSDSQDGSIPRG